MKCDECHEEDPVVTFYPECTLFLCHACNEYHKRNIKSRGHGTVALTELRSKKDVTIQPKAKILVCTEHEYEFKHYCESYDELDTVKKIASRHRQELKKTTTPLEVTISGLSNTHDNIEKMRGRR